MLYLFEKVVYFLHATLSPLFGVNLLVNENKKKCLFPRYSSNCSPLLGNFTGQPYGEKLAASGVNVCPTLVPWKSSTTASSRLACGYLSGSMSTSETPFFRSVISAAWNSAVTRSLLRAEIREKALRRRCLQTVVQSRQTDQRRTSQCALATLGKLSLRDLARRTYVHQ